VSYSCNDDHYANNDFGGDYECGDHFDYGGVMVKLVVV
jgi:hypothetical protein